MHFDGRLLIRRMIGNYFLLFYRPPFYCMGSFVQRFCRSEPVFWLEEQIFKGRRSAGNGGGEVVLIGTWRCL